MILYFLIPIDICFQTTFEESVLNAIILFLFLDLFLNFTTSYFQKGLIVKKRKTIIFHYLKTEFFPDFLSIMFYLLNFTNHEHLWFLKMGFFLRCQKIKIFSQRIQEKYRLNLKIHPSILELINLMVFSFYILNIFACIWLYLALIKNSDEKTWLNVHNFEEESQINQYLYAFYWSIVTMMTVGYGDISATNPSEAIFSSFTIFFGCGLFAYFINAVGIIVQDITKEANIYKYS